MYLGGVFLGNLNEVDRAIARIVRWLSIVMLGGLTVTGTWQFFFHDANTAWDRYELGSDRYLLPTSSTGMAEVHAAFADLAGLLTLFVLAWLSARVLHRVSWFAIGTLGLVIASLYTGTLIRFNTTIENGAVVTDSPGYAQFFLGSSDGAVTDRFELDRLAVIAWTLVHIMSIPLLVLAASTAITRAEERRVSRKGQHRSWLDSLSTARATTLRSQGPKR